MISLVGLRLGLSTQVPDGAKPLQVGYVHKPPLSQSISLTLGSMHWLPVSMNKTVLLGTFANNAEQSWMNRPKQNPVTNSAKCSQVLTLFDQL